MPELPEVETIRGDLAEAVVGRVITAVEWLDARIVRGDVAGSDLAGRLVGRQGLAVGRRGKFLVWRFTSGGGLLLHLGMSGRLTVGPRTGEAWPRHTHLVLALSSGAAVRMVDPRRFGRVAWLEPPAEGPGGMGPEPLSPRFTAERLGQILAGRRAPVKAVLLDQRRVAGLGNIYVDEALHRARLHPARAAGSLDVREVEALHRAIRRVLRDALADRGTTFLDYRDAHGQRGGHQAHLGVYGRAGEPCRRCGAPIVRVVVAARGTHLCARCQPLPGAAHRDSTGNPRAHREPI